MRAVSENRRAQGMRGSVRKWVRGVEEGVGLAAAPLVSPPPVCAMRMLGAKPKANEEKVAWSWRKEVSETAKRGCCRGSLRA